MSNRNQANQEFIRNIFRKGPFQGHGFVCQPPRSSLKEWAGGDFTLSREPLERWVPGLVENYRDQVRFHEVVGDDSIPTAKLCTATHIYAAAFGSPVHQPEESNPCALPFIRTAAEADRIAVPDLHQSPGLERIFELGRLAQRELGRDICLGVPDMQTGFDTMALVWNKEDLFCAMLDDAEKDAVKRLHAKCARLFKTFLQEFRREFPNSSPCHCPGSWTPPELGPWMSNDECGAMGTATFEEFCLPEMIDLAQTFGGIGMHCCADAEHQFASFMKIPGFYGFNRVAARHGYEPILKDLGGPAAPVHVLAWVDEKAIARLVRLAPPGTRFIFNLLGAPLDDAKAWLERMRSLSPRTT